MQKIKNILNIQPPYFQSQVYYKFSSSFKPLKGIRVLDLSRILVGPYCTMFLGDLGAEVIKVEPPEGDETRRWGPPFKGPDATYYLSINRNKKNLCLDIKKAEGLEIINELIKKSDILVENFAPGVTKKLSIDYNTVKHLNPKLIYASVTAFGTTGPWATKAGFDLVNQAVSGLMHITGEPNGAPQKVGVAVTDVMAAMTLGNGIMAALFNRASTNKGTFLETSLFESMVSGLVNQWSSHLNGGADPRRLGTMHNSIEPCGAYETKDGKYFTICVTDKQFKSLCQAIGADDLLNNPNYVTNKGRMTHRAEVEESLKNHFKRFNLKELLQKFDEYHVPGGAVNSIKELFQEEQVKTLNMVQEVPSQHYGNVKLVRNPLRFDGGSLDDMTAPGTLGQENSQILKEILNYSDEKINELVNKNVLYSYRK